MKFLNVYCEKRKSNVYISIDKIILVSAHDDHTLIELEGADNVEVNTPVDELVRMLNGENKTSIGFRTGR